MDKKTSAVLRELNNYNNNNSQNFSKMKSSWTIFAGASDIYRTEELPIACSAKNYIFEEIDKINLEEFRHWIKIHFRQKDSLTYGKETKLVSRNSKGPMKVTGGAGTGKTRAAIYECKRLHKQNKSFLFWCRSEYLAKH